VYLMFVARWDQGAPWASRGIEGASRWLHRLWNLLAERTEGAGEPDPATERELRRVTHQTIKRVSDDFESLEFNTIVAALMELTNALQKHRASCGGSPAWEEGAGTLLLLAAPVAPHLAEELWQRRGGRDSVHRQAWPEYDPAAAAEERLTLIVQIDGKLRDRIEVAVDVSDDEVRAAALASPAVQRRIAESGPPRKLIVVPKRLVNAVF
jgi:leucyl-tRNA synthetase